jgi:hypothetical protein
MDFACSSAARTANRLRELPLFEPLAVRGLHTLTPIGHEPMRIARGVAQALYFFRADSGNASSPSATP